MWKGRQKHSLLWIDSSPIPSEALSPSGCDWPAPKSLQLYRRRIFAEKYWKWVRIQIKINKKYCKNLSEYTFKQSSHSLFRSAFRYQRAQRFCNGCRTFASALNWRYYCKMVTYSWNSLRLRSWTIWWLLWCFPWWCLFRFWSVFVWRHLKRIKQIKNEYLKKIENNRVAGMSNARGCA